MSDSCNKGPIVIDGEAIESDDGRSRPLKILSASPRNSSK